MNNHTHRIIDANVNRASEALRVLEEWTRFSLNNKELTEKLKSIRHFINSCFNENKNLILSRESNLDIGKEIENLTKKIVLNDVLRANSKRAEEALRVLYEYGQLLNLPNESIIKLESYRFEIYSLEKELLINERLFRLNNSKIYFVATPSSEMSDSTFLSIIKNAVEHGLDILQLRLKNSSENRILKLASEIKKIIMNTNTIFILNDRVDLALISGADGVHLGQNDIPISEARKITPNGFIIGLSTHSPKQGYEGQFSGADYLGVGPVFETPTKPDYIPAGLEYVKYASENITLPWFAIGGIDGTNLDKVLCAGAKKIAVVRAILNAKDPAEVIKTLNERLLYDQVK